MERVIGNEYCCAISPPSAPDFCLHIALFYRRCSRAGQPVRSSAAAAAAAAAAAVALASPPPTPPPIGPLPLPPGRCRAQPPTREPRMGRYAVYRLIYGGGGLAHHHQPPLHRLFVETGLAGPVRGLYLDVTGSPETGMRYSEMPGDDPERAAAATSLPPSAFSSSSSSSSTASPPITTTPSSSSPSSPAGVVAAPRALQTKTFIGTIAAEDFDRFREICRHNPPPPRQFDGDRRLVPWVPIRRSQDWVHESIVRSVAEGILDVGLRQNSA